MSKSFGRISPSLRGKRFLIFPQKFDCRMKTPCNSKEVKLFLTGQGIASFAKGYDDRSIRLGSVIGRFAVC